MSVDQDHPNPATGWLTLLNALGTANDEFADGLISQLVNAGTTGQDFDGKAPNFMLSVIWGIQPRDEAECMLAAQMAVVHGGPRRRGGQWPSWLRRLAHVDNIPQQDSAERAFNKLARTFAVQMEALKRYRTGGEQRVTVQHVTVNEGGRAIVGAISPQPGGVGGDKKSEGQPCGSPTGLAHHATLGPGLPSLRSEDRSGKPCGSPAMANGRCRLHGGKSTGPRTAEGLERMRRAKTKHGLYSAESLQLMRAVRTLRRDARRVAGDL